MKPNFFQNILSHLWDIQVDYRPSEINGDLIVLLVKGRYQLCTENAIYSYEDKYDNFGNLFRDHLTLEGLQGTKSLILGLGLGSVPILLEKEVQPKREWQFTAVEIDEMVCELASIYGYPKIESDVQTIIADAAVFLELTEEIYDLVCLDIFIDDVTPSHCTSEDFIQSIKDCTHEKGLVVANQLAFTEEHKKRSKDFFENTFKAIFPNAVLIPTHLNMMCVSNKSFLK